MEAAPPPPSESKKLKDKSTESQAGDNATESVLVDKPGEEDPDENAQKDEPWHDFESQYSFAVSQSQMIEREQWGSQCEFLMSCIASAVGLGNIWRFPFIAGQNGGAAFLIPYLIVLLIIGRPLYMMELGLGQFCTNGPIKIWEMLPIFKGVGFGAALASFFLSTFYCVIMGWSILYFVYSFFSTFPWDTEYTLFNGTHLTNLTKSPETFFVNMHLGVPPYDHNLTDFFNEKGLDGPPVLNIAIALFVSWLLVWAVMVGGVSGSGKIAYFTALFPYVVLLILLVAGCLLDGSGDGIAYFYYPKSWERLGKILEPQAWFQAVGQCFFSLGITFGGVVMFASFNSFHHKLGRDILIISIMDTVTSLLAGTCMFALLGNLAKLENTTVEEIAGDGGAGMAFITFPSVLQSFKDIPGAANVFSILFFFMIIVLAVGSANGLVGTTVTVICDYFPKWKRSLVVTGMCIFCFLCGLVYTCPTGSNVIDIVDRHGSEMFVYVLAIFEVVGVSWVYGLQNLSNDMEFMLGRNLSIYWKICWGFTLPVLLCVIFVWFLATFKANDKWPPLAAACGWMLTVLCWMIVPIVAFFVVQTRKSSSFKKRVKASFFPSRKWGPKDPSVREAWRKWKKTKRKELLLTTQVLYRLGWRTSPNQDNPEAFWSIDNSESQYQTRATTEAPSLAVVPPTHPHPVGAEVAPNSAAIGKK